MNHYFCLCDQVVKIVDRWPSTYHGNHISWVPSLIDPIAASSVKVSCHLPKASGLIAQYVINVCGFISQYSPIPYMLCGIDFSFGMVFSIQLNVIVKLVSDLWMVSGSYWQWLQWLKWSVAYERSVVSMLKIVSDFRKIIGFSG